MNIYNTYRNIISEPYAIRHYHELVRLYREQGREDIAMAVAAVIAIKADVDITSSGERDRQSDIVH